MGVYSLSAGELPGEEEWGERILLIEEGPYRNIYYLTLNCQPF
jgi:hypothetical protein